MPLTKLIDSLNGVCGQKPGIFQRHHPPLRASFSGRLATVEQTIEEGFQ